MYNLEVLKKGCEELSISLNEKQIQQFLDYYEFLVERNKYVNLTSITEYEDVMKKHFLDSLSVVKAIDLNQIRNMIDIGTGGGFPGIPLKIFSPDLEVTLLDSLAKRITFLNETASLLKLEKLETIHGRAEDFAKNKDYREQYDLCVSRAVANLATLSEYCLPYVKKGGYFVSYKSGKVQEELEQSQNAIKLLGGSVENIVYFQLPDSDMERSLVVIKKVKNTPGKYPRKAGLPSKEPL